MPSASTSSVGGELSDFCRTSLTEDCVRLLDLFLAFLQPKFDPSLEQDLAEQDVEEGAPGLPTASSPRVGGGRDEDEEFRPFIRRLPEFQFWLSATKAIATSLVATLFP